jgi:DUF4097 and DUF4098 domain-containing protein YvlB
MTRLLPAAAALLLALPAHDLLAQGGQPGRDLDWTGRVRDGATVRVLTFNGDVTVTGGSGDAIAVQGRARGTDDERARVTFEVLEHADGVTICARTEWQRCTETGVERESRNGRNRSAGSAHLTVQLPRGAHLNASSGNGDVHVTGAGRDVRASSGNGEVEVRGAGGAVRASTGNGAVTVSEAGGGVTASSGNGRITVGTSEGPVRASTGNGAIDVRMASLRGTEDMEFSSGNGRITVRLPADFNGRLDLGTGSGDAYSDFPVTVQGRVQRTRLQGTVGSGGPTVRLRSGNGDVEVRKN